jgi:hypothetical protein
MAWLIGIDEAGYGPNLGPLVIAATVWRVPDHRLRDDLYALVAPAITPFVASAARRRTVRANAEAQGPRPVLVADSKHVYGRCGGLSELERGVLAALGACGKHPTTVEELWRAVDPSGYRQPELFVVHQMRRIPQQAAQQELPTLAGWLAQCLAKCEVELCGIRARAACPSEFNRLLDQYGNKAEVLQVLFLQLVSELKEWLSDGPALVVCDRQGGRTRYAAIAQQVAEDRLVRVLFEHASSSGYRWDGAKGPIELRFETKGERHLPVALASMAAKYLRELAMREFNAWWLQRVPDLSPTAGYPADAGRFMRRIEPLLPAMGIERSALWRER